MITQNPKIQEQDYRALYLQEKARADQLEIALNANFPPLEKKCPGEVGQMEINLWSRNRQKRDKVEWLFKRILDWAGDNVGYGEGRFEKQATGLGILVYLNTVEPELAIRFAAEVCEQHNYHGECSLLMRLYDKVTQPYLHSRHDKQTVNWWAD